MPKAKFKSIISTRRRAKKARMETTEPTVQPGQVLASVSEPQATLATNVPGTSAHVELPSLVLSTASQTAPSTNVTVTQPQTAMVSGSANQVQPEMNAIAPIDVATSSKGTVGNDTCMQPDMFLPNSSLPSMANSTQLSLGYHVDNSTKQKIANGEYINLALLLVRDPSKLQVSTLSMDAQGQIIAQPKNTNKITSIDKWTDAFLIFASIYLTAHPNKTQQLLKYLHDVRLGAEKSQGWVTYDEQYRLRMAINPNGNWGVIDNELWLVYMSPSVAYNNQRASTYYKCFDYNYKGKCTRLQCTYTHRCLKCNDMHPALLCLSSQAASAQTSLNLNRAFRANGPVGQQPQFQTPYQSYAKRQPGLQARPLGPGRFPYKN
ncbi:uncharacterized protein LOC133196870 [Saccostrea echinata]|uniref:uncharacterized protein LOC133196870 n=1 Tax=Saccostrea echinata TaxID=191078 RepID=UPI002A7EFAAD|nr:uncharacterized protein LOC133196870 [Saccostrea echinata]